MGLRVVTVQQSKDSLRCIAAVLKFEVSQRVVPIGVNCPVSLISFPKSPTALFLSAAFGRREASACGHFSDLLRQKVMHSMQADQHVQL
jgi:hypothetical protein